MPRVLRPFAPVVGELALLLALGCALWPLASVHAQATAVPAVSGNHVTIIVLDMSGSMAQNDPDGLRCSAANAYIDLSGPGDYIGVVNLDGGASQAVIADPTEMATQSARKGLRDAIQSKTNGCAPNGSTPTYNALNTALGMLNTATKGGNIAGSVILLTDGVPEPNPGSQISNIKANLVPQFKAHTWPVDVVALGPPGTQDGIDFHGFLSDLASATSGKFYDDGHGVVSGVSPLNIAPFFVDIFARRNGRTPGPTIPPTSLNGGQESRDFNLGSLVDHLDVIVVKDQPGTQVQLRDPNGNNVATGPNVFVSTDPRYAIYTIDGPQAGNWQVNVTGNGQFLVDTLITSSLALSITTPTDKSPVYPLGQPFDINAMLTDKGAVVTNGYTVAGTLSFAGDAKGAAPYTQDIALSGSGGTYTAKATVPESAPAGTYDLKVCASQTTSAADVCADVSLRLSLFPTPTLLDGKGNVADPVAAQVVQFDPALRLLYGIPNGIIDWLSHGPLNNLPATSSADIPGQVKLSGKDYCNATVKGSAQAKSGGASVPITVVNDGCGKFHVLFPSSANGTYTVTFLTSGAFKDSHGDFGTTVHSADVTIAAATPAQELRAWLWTLLLYPLEAFLIISIIRSRFLNAPRGSFTIKGQGGVLPLGPQRSLWWALMARNILSAKTEWHKPGLLMEVERNGSVRVRRLRAPWAAGRNNWTKDDGTPLATSFTRVNEVIFRPTGEHFLFNGAAGRVGGGGGVPVGVGIAAGPTGGRVAPATAARSAGGPPPRTGAPTRSPATGRNAPGGPPPRRGGGLAPPPPRR